MALLKCAEHSSQHKIQQSDIHERTGLHRILRDVPGQHGANVTVCAAIANTHGVVHHHANLGPYNTAHILTSLDRLHNIVITPEHTNDAPVRFSMGQCDLSSGSPCPKLVCGPHTISQNDIYCAFGTVSMKEISCFHQEHTVIPNSKVHLQISEMFLLTRNRTE